MARQPKGRPAITGPDANGNYHCWIPTGEYYPDGKPKRRHIKRKSMPAMADAIDEYERRKRTGHGVAVKVETLGQWMAHYAEHIVKPKREYATWRDVESINRLYITPHLGHWRLSGGRKRLEPEHVEAMYAAMGERGLSDVYVRRTHRILSRALRVAVRRGRADRNVCELFDPPTARKRKPAPLRMADAMAVVREALADPLAARWVLGIIAGPRQGEVLALRWSRVELDPPAPEVPHVAILRKLQRRTWRHGCADPVQCVRKRERRPCRTKPCPPRYAHGCAAGCGRKPAHHCPQRTRVPGCSTHRAAACPPPCTRDCTRHASTCPDRIGGGLVEGQTKSERGERPLAIGTIGAELLRRHREAQQRERGAAWSSDGYVFARPDGRPFDPRADYEAWSRLLDRAGVPHAKLHAARHTAGTYLKATGSKLEDIQEVLGHAQLETTRGYVGVALDVQRDAIDRVAAALIDGELAGLIEGARRVA